MTSKTPQLLNRKPPRKQARKTPVELPPKLTVRHHKPPPTLCKEVFDAAIRTTPSMRVSEEMTRNFVEVSEWAARALGITHGKITFRLHHNQMTEITYKVSANIVSPKKDKFDGVAARNEYDVALKTMTESQGALHPKTVCWCLKTVYSLLFRLSHQEFGTVKLIIRDGELYEIRVAPVIRNNTESTWERIWKALYLRR